MATKKDKKVNKVRESETSRRSDRRRFPTLCWVLLCATVATGTAVVKGVSGATAGLGFGPGLCAHIRKWCAIRTPGQVLELSQELPSMFSAGSRLGWDAAAPTAVPTVFRALYGGTAGANVAPRSALLGLAGALSPEQLTVFFCCLQKLWRFCRRTRPNCSTRRPPASA